MAAKKRSVAPRPRPRARVQTKRRGPGMLDRVITMLPFTDAQLKKAMTWGIVLVAAGGVVVAADLAGVPAMAGEHVARLASQAGFEVKKVEVAGVERMDKLKVYDLVLAEKDRAMPQVDVSRIRNDLLQYGWVRDARVTKRLPDTLVVEITERKPAAVWSHDGKLSLIDADGVVLEEVASRKQNGLPMLIGRDANRRTGDLAALLDAAPALKPRITAASWVGNRRWDLEFRSGETLALPEGKQASAAALANFARMDGVAGLLGKQTTRFDMRDPSRAYFRRASAETPSAQPDSPASDPAPTKTEAE